MSRIETIAPEKASGPSKELLERVETKYGQAPNTAKTMAQAPAVLESYLEPWGPRPTAQSHRRAASYTRCR